MATMADEFHGIRGMMAHGVTTLPFWLAIAVSPLAWYLYLKRPDMPGDQAEARVPGTRSSTTSTASTASTSGSSPAARACSAAACGKRRPGPDRRRSWSTAPPRWWAGSPRWSAWLQSGYIYTYAFGMIIGVRRTPVALEGLTRAPHGLME
jgi:NADH-quinone oxidoreductase subunit L